MNFNNITSINVHSADSMHDALVRALSSSTMLRYSNSNENLSSYTSQLNYYISQQTQEWIQNKLEISIIPWGYCEGALSVMRWSVKDWADSSGHNTNTLLDNSACRFYPLSLNNTFLAQPVKPKMFVFSITGMPEFIELNDINIPPHLQFLVEYARIRMRESQDVVPYPSYLNYFNYPDIGDTVSIRDKVGVFDLDLAVVAVSVFYPDAEIVVDISERILYNSSYKGLTVQYIQNQLNKYE